MVNFIAHAFYLALQLELVKLTETLLNLLVSKFLEKKLPIPILCILQNQLLFVVLFFFNIQLHREVGRNIFSFYENYNKDASERRVKVNKTLYTEVMVENKK